MRTSSYYDQYFFSISCHCLLRRQRCSYRYAVVPERYGKKNPPTGWHHAWFCGRAGTWFFSLPAHFHPRWREPRLLRCRRTGDLDYLVAPINFRTIQAGGKLGYPSASAGGSDDYPGHPLSLLIFSLQKRPGDYAFTY